MRRFAAALFLFWTLVPFAGAVLQAPRGEGMACCIVSGSGQCECRTAAGLTRCSGDQFLAPPLRLPCVSASSDRPAVELASGEMVEVGSPRPIRLSQRPAVPPPRA